MKAKLKLKMCIDLLMTVTLLLLMAYQVTGERFHEWLGVGMFLFFVIHNILNIRWYGSLLKGRYRFLRVLRTVINLSVFAVMLCLAYSGIVMSRYVFAALPINSGMVLARVMHLSGSYWGFVLTGIHLGLHWGMVIGMFHKLCGERKSRAVLWAVRLCTVFIAGYGALCFWQADIFSYMFLKVEFAFIDYEKNAAQALSEYTAMMVLWVFIAYYIAKGAEKVSAINKKGRRKVMKKGSAYLKISAFLMVMIMVFTLGACGSSSQETDTIGTENNMDESTLPSPMADTGTEEADKKTVLPENFVLITGGTFEMGSPDTEAWRSEDEARHTVAVSDFYMSIYEVTQAEYTEVTGNNPSSFSGDDLPVEMVSWMDAVRYCNARSEKEGLTPAYTVEEQTVTWNRAADGYRLPTEAEWEYACRAGTETPFNTETSISAEEANYYGHYPYEIEDNYFSQGNLTTKPGEYRQTTVAVNSFSPNPWGLYNMHGNVGEWVWDYYGTYNTGEQTDPTGAEAGTLRVYRGGGWNDFAKNMRSAYRAAFDQDKGSFNIGIRLVRNAANASGSVTSTGTQSADSAGGKVLIAFFSWGGNTKGIAGEIQAQTGADLFEIELVNPYSNDYNTVLDEAQRDQNAQARPELATHVENMEDYDTIILGYPNWWASIPMPIASFLEEYDFSGKTIIPFCSHGGGRFGQSLTAIGKLVPDAAMGEALSVHYSGGSSLQEDVATWLKENGIIE